MSTVKIKKVTASPAIPKWLKKSPSPEQQQRERNRKVANDFADLKADVEVLKANVAELRRQLDGFRNLDPSRVAQRLVYCTPNERLVAKLILRALLDELSGAPHPKDIK